MDIIEFRATRKQCNDMGFFDLSMKGHRGFVYLNGSYWIIDGYSFSSRWKQRFKSSHGHSGATVTAVEEKLVKTVPAGNAPVDYGYEEMATVFSDLGFQHWLMRHGTRKQIALWLESQQGRYRYTDEHVRACGQLPMTYDQLKLIAEPEVAGNKSVFFDVTSYRAAAEKAAKAKTESTTPVVVVDTI